MDIKINHKMKNNEQTINKCGGRRGCSLDEYIIPNGILDKHYIGESIQISEYVHQSGMIFHKYQQWLLYHWRRLGKKKKFKRRRLLKPLGLCIWCYSTWLYMFLHLILWELNLFTFLGVGINYVILELSYKVFKDE